MILFDMAYIGVLRWIQTHLRNPARFIPATVMANLRRQNSRIVLIKIHPYENKT
jgi:hypothetical protein